MPLIAPAQVLVSPHYTLPGTVIQNAQKSGYTTLLKDGTPLIQLKKTDKAVKVNFLDITTMVGNAQGSYEELPGVSIRMGIATMPTYLQRAKADLVREEDLAASTYNVGGMVAYQWGLRQAHFQYLRNLALYGYAPANGEGILNCPGTYATNLPGDTNGDTIQSMAPGYIANTLNGIFRDNATRTNQLGRKPRLAVVAPQRVIAELQARIVPLTDYQNVGAGSVSIAETVTKSLAPIYRDISWTPDDTLIGKGAGGTDMMIVAIPELQLDSYDYDSSIDTNAFGDNMQPQENGCVLQLIDQAAPLEIIVPLGGGAIDITTELRSTPGWVIRPEAVTKVSIKFA